MIHDSNPSNKKLVKILFDSITADDGVQCRASLNADAVSDYADAMKQGAKFPPLVIFEDGETNWLADGFHRLEALKINGKKQTQCEVRKGTRQDAIKFALSANACHGLRRTNADKRRAVEIALAEWPGLSSAEIARLCAVSHPTVESIRREEQPVNFTGYRVGKDGKSRSLPAPRNALADLSNVRQRFDQLSPDNQAVVGSALCIFEQQGRVVSPDDISELIDNLQQQARN